MKAIASIKPRHLGRKYGDQDAIFHVVSFLAPWAQWSQDHTTFKISDMAPVNKFLYPLIDTYSTEKADALKHTSDSKWVWEIDYANGMSKYLESIRWIKSGTNYTPGGFNSDANLEIIIDAMGNKSKDKVDTNILKYVIVPKSGIECTFNWLYSWWSSQVTPGDGFSDMFSRTWLDLASGNWKDVANLNWESLKPTLTSNEAYQGQMVKTQAEFVKQLGDFAVNFNLAFMASLGIDNFKVTDEASVKALIEQTDLNAVAKRIAADSYIKGNILKLFADAQLYDYLKTAASGGSVKPTGNTVPDKPEFDPSWKPNETHHLKDGKGDAQLFFDAWYSSMNWDQRAAASNEFFSGRQVLANSSKAFKTEIFDYLNAFSTKLVNLMSPGEPVDPVVPNIPTNPNDPPKDPTDHTTIWVVGGVGVAVLFGVGALYLVHKFK